MSVVTHRQKPPAVEAVDFGAAAPRRWSPTTRFVFRVWFVFAVLLILPRSLEFFVRTGVWPSIANWAGRWPMVNLLHLPARQLAGPMSGADYAPDFMAAAVLGAVSVLTAVGWSLATRAPRDHRVLFVWLYTIVRFALGSLLLYYGWDKILPAQFGAGPNLEKVIRPVAQLTPMELLWAFMSASRPYTVFTGLVEFIGGVLLFTRRTALVGAIIAALAMTNVLMLNVAYDVSVKFLAGQMFVMAFSLVAPYAGTLARVFLLHEPHGLAPLRLFGAPRRDQLARIGGGVLAAVMIVWTYEMAHRVVTQITGGERSFHGVWEVTSLGRPEPVSLVVTQTELWRYLVFPGDNTAAFVYTMSGEETPYAVRIDETAGRLTLTPRPIAADRVKPSEWKFTFADADRVELRSPDEVSRAVAITLQRVDTRRWRLVAHRHAWRW